MAYSTPLTAVANATLTAAQWNASVRDNILETAVGKATAANQIFVATAANTLAARVTDHDSYNGGGTDATNSTTYTALTGGAAAVITTGTRATVFNTARISHDVAGSRSYVSYAISGATTLAADDSWAIVRDQPDLANRVSTSTYVSQHESSITAGSNTFTQQFKVGSNTMTCGNRRILVFPF